MQQSTPVSLIKRRGFLTWPDLDGFQISPSFLLNLILNAIYKYASHFYCKEHGVK